jgi:hypothetical protein
MKIAYEWVGASLILASCVTINDQRPNAAVARQATEAAQIRGALSGQRQLIASFYATAPDCTSLGYPTLKVSRPPQYGQVSVEQGTALADFGNDDARRVCNGKSVPATVIYYISEYGFTGADAVEFERIGVAGAYGVHAFTINVR